MHSKEVFTKGSKTLVALIKHFNLYRVEPTIPPNLRTGFAQVNIKVLKGEFVWELAHPFDTGIAQVVASKSFATRAGALNSALDAAEINDFAITGLNVQYFRRGSQDSRVKIVDYDEHWANYGVLLDVDRKAYNALLEAYRLDKADQRKEAEAPTSSSLIANAETRRMNEVELDATLKFALTQGWMNLDTYQGIKTLKANQLKALARGTRSIQPGEVVLSARYDQGQAWAVTFNSRIFSYGVAFTTA